jgi:hypothetical protein
MPNAAATYAAAAHRHHPDSLRYKITKAHPLDHVKVYTSDDEGEPAKLSVSKHRQRAQKLCALVNQYTWTVVEMFDAKGGMLDRHQRSAYDEPNALDLEDISNPNSTGSARAAEVSSYVALNLRSIDTVLQHMHRFQAPLYDSLVKLNEIVFSRNLMLSENLESEQRRTQRAMVDQIAAMRDAAMQAVKAAGIDDGERSDKLVEHLLPAVVQAMFTPKEEPKKASNGASNGASSSSSKSSPGRQSPNGRRAP